MAKNNDLTALGCSVELDIQVFMLSLTRIFTCEADFQLTLAEYLRDTKKYDNVFLEYAVPRLSIGEIIAEVNAGNTNVSEKKESEDEGTKKEEAAKKEKIPVAHIDIVVEKDSEFVPIELKFKTISLNWPNAHYICFGYPTDIYSVSNMEAQSDNRYKVWIDVGRIEWIKSHFPLKVKNGFVVFHTNDSKYQKSNVNYALANCTDFNPQESPKEFANKNASSKDPLKISNKYDIIWLQHKCITIENKYPKPPFFFTIIEV